MEKAKSKVRIKFGIILMGLTIVGCLVMIASGRRAMERGESLAKINEDYKKELVAKYKAKESDD